VARARRIDESRLRAAHRGRPRGLRGARANSQS
jgi:hypothetical protein